MMTAAASVTFFTPEFDDFLHAPVGAKGNEMPLSVLSALSRLNLDPWKEAAELSELSKDTAKKRLASLIARLPGGTWTLVDAKVIAERLIELLPHRSSPKPGGETRSPHVMSVSSIALICAALALVGLVAAVRWEQSRNDEPGPPAYSTGVPPQTSVPSSR